MNFASFHSSAAYMMMHQQLPGLYGAPQYPLADYPGFYPGLYSLPPAAAVLPGYHYPTPALSIPTTSTPSPVSPSSLSPLAQLATLASGEAPRPIATSTPLPVQQTLFRPYLS